MSKREGGTETWVKVVGLLFALSAVVGIPQLTVLVQNLTSDASTARQDASLAVEAAAQAKADADAAEAAVAELSKNIEALTQQTRTLSEQAKRLGASTRVLQRTQDELLRKVADIIQGAS